MMANSFFIEGTNSRSLNIANLLLGIVVDRFVALVAKASAKGKDKGGGGKAAGRKWATAMASKSAQSGIHVCQEGLQSEGGAG
jgi:hypothetical protein